MFSPEVWRITGHGLSKAPSKIPDKWLDAFTVGGRIHLSHWYINQGYFGAAAETPNWEWQAVEDMKSEAEKGILEGTYGVEETNHLRAALLHAPGIINGRHENYDQVCISQIPGT